MNISGISGVFPLIFAAFIVLMLSTAVIITVRTRQQKIAARTWYSVPVRILKSYVATGTRWERTGSGPHATSRPVHYYYPIVIYQYLVNGQLYEGNRISFDFNMSTVQTYSPQTIVDRYPVGSEQTAYYDPKRPERSVLDRGF